MVAQISSSPTTYLQRGDEEDRQLWWQEPAVGSTVDREIHTNHSDEEAGHASVGGCSFQKFTSVMHSVHTHFNTGRHLNSRSNFNLNRVAA
jgi:hypothetical protein